MLGRNHQNKPNGFAQIVYCVVELNLIITKYTTIRDSWGIYRALSWSTSLPQVKRIAVHDEYLSSHARLTGRTRILGSHTVLKVDERNTFTFKNGTTHSTTFLGNQAFCAGYLKTVRSANLRLVYLSLEFYNFTKRAQLRRLNPELNTNQWKCLPHVRLILFSLAGPKRPLWRPFTLQFPEKKQPSVRYSVSWSIAGDIFCLNTIQGSMAWFARFSLLLSYSLLSGFLARSIWFSSLYKSEYQHSVCNGFGTLFVSFYLFLLFPGVTAGCILDFWSFYC